MGKKRDEMKCLLRTPGEKVYYQIKKNVYFDEDSGGRLRQCLFIFQRKGKAYWYSCMTHKLIWCLPCRTRVLWSSLPFPLHSLGFSGAWIGLCLPASHCIPPSLQIPDSQCARQSTGGCGVGRSSGKDEHANLALCQVLSVHTRVASD